MPRGWWRCRRFRHTGLGYGQYLDPLHGFSFLLRRRHRPGQGLQGLFLLLQLLLLALQLLASLTLLLQALLHACRQLCQLRVLLWCHQATTASQGKQQRDQCQENKPVQGSGGMNRTPIRAAKGLPTGQL